VRQLRVTELPHGFLVITPNRTDPTKALRAVQKHPSASLGGGGEIRTRGALSARRFSRPVVSTAHPPLPYDRLELYRRWRASVRLLRSRKKFCTVLKAFAMSGSASEHSPVSVQKVNSLIISQSSINTALRTLIRSKKHFSATCHSSEDFIVVWLLLFTV
jgi:hypothetical protein